jgi:hypothetical protein
MTFCSWCDVTIAAAGAGAAVAAPTSHGICRSCLDEKLVGALPDHFARIAWSGASRPACGLGPITRHRLPLRRPDPSRLPGVGDELARD